MTLLFVCLLIWIVTTALSVHVSIWFFLKNYTLECLCKCPTARQTTKSTLIEMIFPLIWFLQHLLGHFRKIKWGLLQKQIKNLSILKFHISFVAHVVWGNNIQTNIQNSLLQSLTLLTHSLRQAGCQKKFLNYSLEHTTHLLK